MATFRQHISDIVTELKAYNLDDSIPYKFIAHKLQDEAQVLLKQDSEYRKLLKNPSIFLTIDCLDLQDAEPGECGCDVRDLISLKKSCRRLPDVYESSYGNIIKVLTVDYAHTFTRVDPFSYKDYKNRRFGPKRFFWEIDGYIFIPDSMVDSVMVIGAFKYNNEVDEINKGVKNCTGYLDAEFNFPDYITSIAKSETIKKLSSVFLQIPNDDNPNLNTSQKQ